MTKTSKETMMKDEMKVLDVLEQHGNESVDKIAKRCGISRQKVWRIVKRLDEKKIIWGYAAIADEEAKDLKHFVLLMKRSMVSVDTSMQEEIVLKKLDARLPDLVKVEDIFVTHGNYNWVVTFYAPDLITAKKTLETISNQGLGKYFDEYLLLETLFPIRKKGFKNPQIKKLVEYI